MLSKVVLHEKMALFNAHWQPKLVGVLNDQQIKLLKFQGEFVWHKHDDTDEMFLVISGDFTMKLRDGDIQLQQGDFMIIPAGVEHCPYAEHEVQVMLIEKMGTLNTGDAPTSDKTAQNIKEI